MVTDQPLLLPCRHIYVYIYMYMYVGLYVCVLKYTHMEREGEDRIYLVFIL